tara:strand:- start:7793 stop:8038 length:246 start_codon:yes stop_codon:yes gene_type:complete
MLDLDGSSCNWLTYRREWSDSIGEEVILVDELIDSEEVVLVDKVKYAMMVEDSLFLENLQLYGVSNWEGYKGVQGLMEEIE